MKPKENHEKSVVKIQENAFLSTFLHSNLQVQFNYTQSFHISLYFDSPGVIQLDENGFFAREQEK